MTVFGDSSRNVGGPLVLSPQTATTMADTTPTVSSTAPSSDISVPPQKIRHEWFVLPPPPRRSHTHPTCTHRAPSNPRRYQTDNEVVLSVFIKNVKPEELKVDLLERSVRPLPPLQPTPTPSRLT